MILLDLLTARAALALADSESADWLTRPCGGAEPDHLARDGEPEWPRGVGDVVSVQHGKAN